MGAVFHAGEGDIYLLLVNTAGGWGAWHVRVSRGEGGNEGEVSSDDYSLIKRLIKNIAIEPIVIPVGTIERHNYYY